MFFDARRVTQWMVASVVSAAVLVGAVAGASEALAVSYGGAVAWANVGLLLWCWRRGATAVHRDAARHLRSFHRSLLERFLVVGALLALGFVLSAHPQMLLAGFMVGQLAWLLAGLALRERT